MRALILVAGASLAVSACNPKQDADNAAATADNLAAEAIIANDTTAIDAATGDAANMAADVDYSVNQLAIDSDRVSSGNRSTARRRPSEPVADANTTEEAPAETAVETNGV